MYYKVSGDRRWISRVGFSIREFFFDVLIARIINFLEHVNGRLHASFSGNLPVADSDLIVARFVFGKTDAVAGTNATSQCTNGAK